MKMLEKLFVPVALAASLVACSADSTDYKQAAEDLIVETLEDQGVTGTATCEEPASTEVGTVFNCTASYDGTTEEVPVTILEGERVGINVE